MLPEGEDLLQQLSGELGLPEFLEDVAMMEDNNVLAPPGIYDSLIDDLHGTSSWLNDVTGDTTSMTNGISSMNSFPPSPSNSDTSSGTSSAYDVLSPKSAIGNFEVTPPVSPPSSNIINPSATSIVSVPDLSNVKIPIPKIQKPSKFYNFTMKKFNANANFMSQILKVKVFFPEPPPPKAPLVLTSDQFAQLAQNGVLKLTTTTTASQFTSTALTSTTTSPVMIKSEPCPLSLGGTPTVQTISQNNFSQEDVSLISRLILCHTVLKNENLTLMCIMHHHLKNIS